MSKLLPKWNIRSTDQSVTEQSICFRITSMNSSNVFRLFSYTIQLNCNSAAQREEQSINLHWSWFMQSAAPGSDVEVTDDLRLLTTPALHEFRWMTKPGQRSSSKSPVYRLFNIVKMFDQEPDPVCDALWILTVQTQHTQLFTHTLCASVRAGSSIKTTQTNTCITVCLDGAV